MPDPQGHLSSKLTAALHYPYPSNERKAAVEVQQHAQAPVTERGLTSYLSNSKSSARAVALAGALVEKSPEDTGPCSPETGCAFALWGPAGDVPVTWGRQRSPSQKGSGEQGDGVGTELNQVSIPQGKLGFRSQPEGWVQGECLRAGGPRCEGLESERREGTRQARPCPGRPLPVPAYSQGTRIGTDSGHRVTKEQVRPQADA